MKPAPGAPTLNSSVEAEGRATDLCTGRAPADIARERILAWLAEGAREVTWALCWLPRERWAEQPPAWLGDWPVLRHVRHVAVHERHQILPAVRQALGEATGTSSTGALEIEPLEATWDSASAVESAESLLRGFGETRFELLQRLETAPDDIWHQPPSAPLSPQAPSVASPVALDWLLLSARQHEQQHLAAIWKIALNWDRAPLENAAIPGVPLHPADRLEESH